MAYPSGFVKVVFSGTMLSGAEIWSCSLSVLPPFTSGDRADEIRADLLPVLVSAGSAWFERAASGIHTTAELRTIKANMVGADGLYISDSETVYEDIPEGQVNGANTGQMLPPQLTAAVSLRTAAARGLAARGRFYPPATTVSVDPSTGGMSTAAAQGMAESAATLLGAINGVEGYSVVVASPLREGAINDVTRVEVGTILDTQRRRRSALPEVYRGAVVAPG